MAFSFKRSAALTLFLVSAVWAASFSSIFARLLPIEPLKPHENMDRGRLSPSKGMFLVAGRGMKDPVFNSTVILLVEYGANGSAGLIINRPSPVMKLKDSRPDAGGARGDDPLFLGGPVEMSMLSALIRSIEPVNDCSPVFPGVCVSADAGLLDENIKAGTGPDRFRVYAGYAGWAPNQLEMELAGGWWRLVEADAEAIFVKGPAEVWEYVFLKNQWKTAP